MTRSADPLRSRRTLLLFAAIAGSIPLFLGHLTASAAPPPGAPSPLASKAGAPPAPPGAHPPALPQPAAPAVVLYDQYNNDGGDGIVSANITASPTFNSKAADDFVVPAGPSWSINQVDVRSYPGIPAESNFNVFFYTNSGILPGTQVAAQTNLAYSGTNPDYSIPLSSPVILNPGTYWVSVQANMSSTAWYWGMRSVQSNSAAAWQEAGGFGTGCNAPAWGNRGTCTGTSTKPDQMFRLNGTLQATGGPITINDPTPGSAPGNPYPSTIDVGGLSGTVTDVNVTLTGLSHTFPDDIDLMLVGPGGAANTLLMSDACGGEDVSGINLTFDDAAAAGLPDVTAVGSPCTSGTYQPTNFLAGDTFPAPAPSPSATVSLANFNGTAPNGTWSLYVVDDLGQDMGQFAGWSIEITTSGSSATTFSNASRTWINDLGKGKATPYPDVIGVSGRTGTVTDVNVTLTGLSHTNPDDIDILLVGPTGAKTLLMSDACGVEDVSGIDVTFDDAAAATLPDSTVAGLPCTSGSYKPTNFEAGDLIPDVGIAPTAASLAVFNGTDPNGAWSLYVVDDRFGDTGSIAQWSLTITTSTPTAVWVARLSARRVAGGAAVSWRTASEVELAGFDVYRGGAKLNRSLIPAKRSGTSAGASYRFVDRSLKRPAKAIYRLELVRLDGRRIAGGTTTLASGS